MVGEGGGGGGGEVEAEEEDGMSRRQSRGSGGGGSGEVVTAARPAECRRRELRENRGRRERGEGTSEGGNGISDLSPHLTILDNFFGSEGDGGN